ncbi:AEC family transporter [Actinomadura barringtoniae]|uniref:AEC family transporter n=1 Tax=Actinomadura barringtoniae TaxID=1427535 RepID=A0A939PDU6_9ACTN|nr:AEC family transporter [Actinomadura barringtoniae]MBO2451002.1 AEC family transporter [Actinomadura barringtoniae]
MRSILSEFLPIWIIAGLGWAASRSGVVARQGREALTAFAFTFAMPAVLFTMLTKVALGDLPFRPLIAFAVSTLTVAAAALALVRWVFHGKLAEQVIAAMSAGYVNAGNLGIPVALYVLHDASFVMAVLVFQVMVMTPLIFMGLDLGREGDAVPGAWKRSLLAPLRNPLVLGASAGLVVSALSWHPPKEVMRPLELLGGAAVPVALFVLGMALDVPRSDTAANRGVISVVVSLKLVAQPLIAFVVGREMLHLNQAALYAVVLFAALPTAQNTFLYATRYNGGTELPRDAILISTLLSMVTVSVVSLLLRA